MSRDFRVLSQSRWPSRKGCRLQGTANAGSVYVQRLMLSETFGPGHPLVMGTSPAARVEDAQETSRLAEKSIRSRDEEFGRHCVLDMSLLAPRNCLLQVKCQENGQYSERTGYMIVGQSYTLAP
ncbi:hypothetical protein CGRA01v4_05785 [Colletotrichum graminicola]|nr:hypothetical protein CGRA01v4_05785 [Colletotrichum graminicola]